MGTCVSNDMGEFATISETTRFRLSELVAETSHASCRSTRKDWRCAIDGCSGSLSLDNNKVD